MSSRLRRLALPTVAVVFALAACGGSSKSSSSPGTTANSAASTTTSATTEATTTSEAATSTAATTTPATSAAPTTVAGSALSGALLTVEDMPAGFSAQPGEKDDSSQPTLCGTPKAEKIVPSSEQAQVDLTNDDAGLFLEHNVYRYRDATQATAALVAGNAGLACLKGSSTASDGSVTNFDLQKQQLPAGLGDATVAYQGSVSQSGQDYNAIIVAIQNGRALSVLKFVASAGADAPDATPIIQSAAQKLTTVA